MLRKFVAAVFAVLIHLPGIAAEAVPASDDPVLEKRVMEVGHLLRCLVCQNQTIADSHAELAVDLKNEIREMMRAGKSDQEIIDFMVARYGDFVLYKPQVKSTTWLLWFGPGVLLVLGLGTLFVKLRRRTAQIQAAELTPEQKRQAYSLLEQADGGDSK
ncbi:MAG: cytochrome c-type biogenesis protein CcmH [Rhodocyclaceae bacterium]|nr:cytochrome c-type biogenesis protein CcmH [Rhodocyclaceae bacterium]